MSIEKQHFTAENYILFEIKGFNNMILKNPQKIELDDSIFREILINDKLSEITLYFDEDTNKEIKEITQYAHSVIFEIVIRFILNSEIDVSSPDYKVKLIRFDGKDQTEITLNDRIPLREEFNFIRSFDSMDFLKEVLAGGKLINSSNALLYRKLFSIMKNTDRVVKYMVLYDFLMEIVSEGKARKEQKNVCDFIKAQGFDSGFNSIGFRQTRRTGMSFEEDDFTYYRNEIAHAEFENDFNKYESLSSSITNTIINKLIEVIHCAIKCL